MKSKSISIRFLALMLSTMVFLSSTGVRVDMHFCRGQLRSLNLNGDAKSCVEKATGCPKHVQKEERKSCPLGCCSDKTIEVEPLTELFVQHHLYSTYLSLDLVWFQPFLDFTVPSPKNFTRSPLVYKPPKIIRNRVLVLESFLL